MDEPNRGEDDSFVSQIVLLLVGLVAFLLLIQFGIGALSGGLVQGLMESGFPPVP